jgi:hypothetical protein
MLNLLVLLGWALAAMALMGLWIPPGEAGGELAMMAVCEVRTKCAVSQVSQVGNGGKNERRLTA